MVGRNDPCPCGSGKKYKKCCGREEAVDLQQVIDAELDGIIMGFAEAGLEPKELNHLNQLLSKWNSALSTGFGKQTIELLAFEAFVFHDRADIWRDYIEQKMKTQKRQRVLDVLALWKEPFYLLAEILEVGSDALQVRENVSGEIRLLEKVGGEKPGESVFGIVMESLRDGKSVLKPMQGLITIPEFDQELIKKLTARLKDGFSDSLELYELFAEASPDLGLTPFQQDVMALVAEFIDQYGLNGEVIEGIAFTFLKEVPLNARKPEGVAAGILQAACDFGLFEENFMTQNVIAEKLKTSTGTLSKYADMVGEFVIERIEKDKGAPQPSEMPVIVTEMGTDPRLTERNLWEVLKLSMNAKSEAELNKILQQPNKKYKPTTDAERAQLLCYEAFETSGKERERLAREALMLDPKSGDANLLMAEFVEHTVEKELHFLNALNTGYRTFDNSFDVLWGYVPNRPFLRALFSYGAWLMEQGRYDKAIEQLTEIMDKNPLDHQGAKWLLLSAYIRAGEWGKAGEFSDGFALAENTGIGMYFHYLSDLHTGILKPHERSQMKDFVKKRNPHLFKLLKEGKKPGAFPKHLTLQEGTKDEAKLIYWLIYGIPEVESFIG
ncbi:MAG TPA: SEC-C metal-binding domain-containing protein [Planococcus sp. (in: firmicutes)]|nr:SEC-C metal-binding domain-containing protein [Planococcus sp. (in: firmicutes)]